MLTIKGRVLIGGELVEATIYASEEGFVEKVEAGTGAGSPSSEVLDFGKPGLAVLPGVVDLHVHLRDWAESYKEDVSSGTAAAAAGGVVLVGDMPNTSPPVNSLDRARERDELLSSRSLVDYVLYAKPPKDPRELPGLLEVAAGVKVYPEDWPLLEELLRAGAPSGALLVFHAEHPKCLAEKPWRPPECEAEAVRELLSAVSELDVRAHFTHVSSRLALAELAKAKASPRRARLTADATPHHLLLSEEDARRLGPLAKVHPPLRSKEDVEFLQGALAKGILDAIASDHAPHAPWEKERLERAKPGVPGLETLVPLTLTLALKLGLPFASASELLSKGPARVLGLSDLLGEVKPGALASFTVVDLKSSKRVAASSFKSKAKFSPFEGWELVGWPVATIVRSRLVYDSGEVVDRGQRGENALRLLGKGARKA